MSTLRARDEKVLWHPYTQHGLDREPLEVRAARGAVLELSDGREMIDAISSWWTCLHGHGRPELADALRTQAETLDHVLFAGCTHEPAVRLAEELVEVTPPGLERVFYSDDGSTAVEVALKMVYQSWVLRGQPERTVFVALDGAYHGDTFGAMAVGEREPFFGAFGPLLFDVRHVPAKAGPLADALDELGERAAGVILEPLVQGAAGMVMHGVDFVRATRAACDARGIPMIADEVMTGFGRTGSLFACGKAGVSPDVMCLAKGLTGGVFPLSATVATSEIFDTFVSDDRSRTFFHGHTFTGNPIGCAVALASLALVRAEDTPARLDAIGARIDASVAEALRMQPGIRDIRRTGGIVAVELEAADGGGYLSGSPEQLRRMAVEHGVLIRPLGNVLYAMPPACTTGEQADRIAEVLVELAVAAAPDPSTTRATGRRPE